MSWLIARCASSKSSGAKHHHAPLTVSSPRMHTTGMRPNGFTPPNGGGISAANSSIHVMVSAVKRAVAYRTPPRSGSCSIGTSMRHALTSSSLCAIGSVSSTAWSCGGIVTTRKLEPCGRHQTVDWFSVTSCP